MFHLATTVPSACLIGAGAIVWALASKPLSRDANLDFPLNPFGIDRSPYGEVFAMAMQGPIDNYFDATADHSGHGHEATEEHARPAWSAGRFENLLASLDGAEDIRTNPHGESAAHKFYLRRQVEDRLRFAYNLDPAHYGNYNSLHFFLTEPELGTRPALTSSAAKLAEDTVRYCLAKTDDPRPALTAAAACTNILGLMFDDSRTAQPRFTTAQMRQNLAMLDFCISRYTAIAGQWTATGQWSLLSPMRVQECEERFHFICKIRDTHADIIARLEGKSPDQASR